MSASFPRAHKSAVEAGASNRSSSFKMGLIFDLCLSILRTIEMHSRSVIKISLLPDSSQERSIQLLHGICPSIGMRLPSPCVSVLSSLLEKVPWASFFSTTTLLWFKPLTSTRKWVSESRISVLYFFRSQLLEIKYDYANWGKFLNPLHFQESQICTNMILERLWRVKGRNVR